MNQALFTAGRQYLNNGLSIMVIGADKVPVHQWTSMQTVPMAVKDLEKYVSYSHSVGIGIITGYADLEVLDFDLKHDDTGTLMQEYEARIPAELKEKMLIIQTRSGGYHWAYKCSEIEGNLKLARKENKEVLIETRGKRGYIATVPTAKYKHISGKLQWITPEERAVLFAAARSLNRLPEPPKYIPPEIPYSGETRPGDDYSLRGDIVLLMRSAGWAPVDNPDKERLYFLRPGSDATHSSNWHIEKRVFKCFSSSTEFEEGRAYKLFSVYTILHHGGDPSAAAKILRMAGFGQPD